MGDRVLNVEEINSRWLLKNVPSVISNNDIQLSSVDAPSHNSFREKVYLDQSGIEDEVRQSDQFRSILAEAEVKYRECQSVTESNALGDMLKKALEDHRKFVEEFRSMDGPIGLPKADHISKVGRPAKEKSFSPWRQISGAVSKAKQTKEGNVFIGSE